MEIIYMPISTEDVTIATSGTTTAASTHPGKTLIGVKTPAAMTGTAISFLICDTANGTFLPFYNPSDTLVSVTVAVGAARYIGIDQNDFYGVNHIKVVSNDTEVAARTLTLIFKD